MRRAAVLVPILLGCVITGCGTGFEKTYPVTGSLLVDDVPAHRAKLVFFPVGEGAEKRVKPVAVVGEDGNYTVTTFLTGDGAPAGEYMVTVVWPKYEIVEHEEIDVGDLLKGQFNDHRNPFLKVTIKPADNKIPPIKLAKP